ncbi:MAG: DUF6340 family protein [Dysgonamonadaceae bacterium]|jgi:hypothetical protein|nr:DUF6340 family protein [Dysgonamonadaceae bacterium]
MKALVLPLLLIAASCTGVYRMTIEVQEPAPVTLPPDIAGILLVDNSAQQAGSQGVVLTYNGKAVPDYALHPDSVLRNTLLSSLQHLHAAQFFNTASLYNRAVRDDKEWMTTIPLPEEFRAAAFEKPDIDGIVSIDRSLLKVEGLIKNNSLHPGFGASTYVDFRTTLHLTCSIYLYGGETPPATFTVTDSLNYKSTLWGDSLFFFNELPGLLLDELAYRTGESLAARITPSWTLRERTLYRGPDARMQEAFAYAKTRRWDVAGSLWLAEWDKRTKRRDKARIANNLAVANEMRDQLETALHWAEQARAYAAPGSAEQTLAGEYAESLQQRMQDSRLLDIQWGK